MKEAEVTPLNTSSEPINEDSSTRTRIKGKILKTYPGGYGFITSEERKFTRFYFYWTALRNRTKNFVDIKPNDPCEFEPFEYIDHKSGENKGWRAKDIEILERVEYNKD